MCGELNLKDENSSVKLCGWVRKRRDHGNVIFIDLRDISGITQIVFDSAENKETYLIAKLLKPEYVIRVMGKVRGRPQGMVNKNIVTGEIEVMVNKIEILNEAKTPPFTIIDNVDATEESRFRYRYLDLRRNEMQHTMIIRHKTAQIVRRYLDSQNFLEI